MTSQGSEGIKSRFNDGVKQRIVGALVLVALAVIFLPSLLDREQALTIDTTTQIPPPTDIPQVEINEPVADESIPPPPALAEVFQPPSASESAKNSPDLDTATDEPILDKQGLPTAWVVQVASYQQKAKAERLRSRLLDEGYRAYTRVAKTPKGEFIRVFVGPKINRTDAEAVKTKLDQLLNTQTLILRFKT
ncbi:MAG: SPOR domain-containing protein [Gammaproteobacteria bacterium]|nr:SPOR domain-containing protein [Gammaproteobacteria bacterium]